MAALVSIILFLIAGALFVLMLVQHIRGTHPLLSLRNFAIVGFVIYQLTSAGMGLYTGELGQFLLERPERTGFIYLVMLLVFMFLFSRFYRRGWGIEPVVRRIPVPREPSTAFSIAMLAVAMTALGLGLRFGLRFPLIGIVADKWGMALSVMACGMAAWLWARRMSNPLLALFTVLIVGLNGINLLSSTFGRRPLVAAGAAILLAMFYASWRYFETKRLLTRLAVVGLVPVIAIGLFTAGREAQDFDRTASEQVRAMLTADAWEGVSDVLAGQACGPVSMWLIESYPERFEYRHLLALRYLFIMPIPREWWEDKPTPLSNQIAREATLSGVNVDILKIGPGIIGHSAAEGGWYALIIYAFIGAWVLRLGDELIWRNPQNPLVVLALGSALGDTTGLARGEASAFMFNMLFAIGGAYTFSLVAGMFLTQSAPAEEPTTPETAATDPWIESATT